MSETTAPRELPVLFGDPLVREILADRKTQTRRMIKPQPVASTVIDGWRWMGRSFAGGWSGAAPKLSDRGIGRDIFRDCPFGAPGDRLWVREAFACLTPGSYEDAPRIERGCLIEYRATDSLAKSSRDVRGYSYRPSIHMPRWASRLLLDVVDVRVERLQDITEEDARAEGATSRTKCHGYEHRYEGWSMNWSRVGQFERHMGRPLTESDISLGTARMAFANQWNAIYGAESWDANPWVWVVEFKRVDARAEAA